MKKLIIYSFLTFAFVWGQAQTTYSPVKNAEEATKLLLEASVKVNSIKSSFTQEKHLEFLSSVIESKGSFWFQKENNLRWEYKEPFKYIIVASKGKFTIKDETKTSTYDVNSNQAFKKLNDILISTVNGNIIHSKDFEIDIKESKKEYLVQLKPLNTEMAKVLKTIELYFLKSDLTVARVKMIESNDDYTSIRFYNKEINTKIDQKIFNLK